MKTKPFFKGPKLNANDAIIIQDYLRSKPYTLNTELAAMFKVTPGMISHIRHGRHWAHAKESARRYRNNPKQASA